MTKTNFIVAGNKQPKQGGLIEIVSGESKLAPLIGAFEGSVGGVVIANRNTIKFL